MSASNGYFLADTNSLVYAYRAGGTQLLDTYREIARAEERRLAITKTVADEIEKGPLGEALLRYIDDKNIPILENSQTEQRLRAGEITRKNAGEESIVEVARREHAAGRSTPVLADDKYFASLQKLSEAPGVQPVTSAELLNQAREDRFINEAKYREHLAGYRMQAPFRTGSPSYSPRLDTFDPHHPTLMERVGERLAEPRTAQLSLKAAGPAAVAVDAVITARETASLLDQDNLPGAQSKIVHFGARNIGMAGGAALGSSAGAAFGAPGMVIGGIAGGIGGGVAGESVAEVADRARIYTQRGSDGHAWQSDPQHPERGWSRHAPAYGTDARGKATYDMQTLQANPRLASELDYKASSTAVELALAHAPDPRNPFSQPAGPGDAHAVDATPWTRDPATRQWSRYVADPTQAAMGNPTGSFEQASPQRSAELDRAAQATIAHNVDHSRQGIAQQYQSAYDERNWKQHGPVPAAVLHAERTPSAQQPAPAPAARANPVLTPQQIEAAVAPRVAPQESHAPRVKPAPGGMSFAEAHQRREEPEKTSPGSLQPVGKQAQPDRLHELTLLREIGIVNAKTEQELGKAQGAPTRTPASPEPTQERAPQPAAQETPALRQAPAAQTSRPMQSEHTVTPVAAAAPLTLAAAAAPMQSASAEPSSATAPVAPPTPRGGSDISAVHAQVAALQEQIARLTEQRGQDHPAPRSASDERFTAPAAIASRTEPVASARTMDPRDASHPDHRDFQKIYTAIAQDGRWDAKQSGNIASQVLADFKAGPMGLRLDVVAIEPDLKGQLKVFAGHAPWGEHRGLLGPTVVDPTQAARVPAEQGFERLAQAVQQREMAQGQAGLQR